MGLRGYAVVASDFKEDLMRDKSVTDIVPVVRLTPVEGQAPHCASMDVYLEDGETLHAETAVVRGHPDNPLNWDDLHAKFQGLVQPVVGKEKTEQLFEAARSFGPPGSMQKLSALLQGEL